MALYIFARFHARPGAADAVEAAIAAVVAATRREPGCLAIDGFRSVGDERLYYVHSRWLHAAAFDEHSVLPHTVHFLETVAPLIDHPLDVTRASLVT